MGVHSNLTFILILSFPFFLFFPNQVHNQQSNETDQFSVNILDLRAVKLRDMKLK